MPISMPMAVLTLLLWLVLMAIKPG